MKFEFPCDSSTLNFSPECINLKIKWLFKNKWNWGKLSVIILVHVKKSKLSNRRKLFWDILTLLIFNIFSGKCMIFLKYIKYLTLSSASSARPSASNTLCSNSESCNKNKNILELYDSLMHLIQDGILISPLPIKYWKSHKNGDENLHLHVKRKPHKKPPRLLPNSRQGIWS